mmetsp:Transcript_64704/g.173313  ORF Transcript_64704/g.173313 Transcript_64704/m.173313 type:complete len:255 (-) Transcript_64704:93-857(-)
MQSHIPSSAPVPSEVVSKARLQVRAGWPPHESPQHLLRCRQRAEPFQLQSVAAARSLRASGCVPPAADAIGHYWRLICYCGGPPLIVRHLRPAAPDSRRGLTEPLHGGAATSHGPRLSCFARPNRLEALLPKPLHTAGRCLPEQLLRHHDSATICEQTSSAEGTRDGTEQGPATRRQENPLLVLTGICERARCRWDRVLRLRGLRVVLREMGQPLPAAQHRAPLRTEEVGRTRRLLAARQEGGRLEQRPLGWHL